MIISGTELKDFAKKYDVKFIGDFTVGITGFCSLNNPKSDCITWVKKPTENCLEGFKNASNIIVVMPEYVDSSINNCRYIIASNPKEVFFAILSYFWKNEIPRKIENDSVVETNDVGDDVYIGHHCYINAEVKIGNNTIIENNVSIVCPTVIGDNCIIHSGVVLGTDGFGYYQENGIPTKVDHYGGIIIGNNVEIGANTCIDRATIDNTVIGNNVKIDNLVHIGHNVIVDDNSMIIAQAMLGGSAHLKNNSYIAPCASVMNQITIGENALVGMGAVVTKEVGDDTVVAGVPARAIKSRVDSKI